MGVGTVMSFPSRDTCEWSPQLGNPARPDGPTPLHADNTITWSTFHRQHGQQPRDKPVHKPLNKYTQADLRTIDLMEERGLDRSVIAGLDAGNYLGQRLNVVFQGATGSGKSHLLCALAKSACRGRYRAIYVRMPDLAEQVTAAAGKPGGVPKLVRKYSTYNLLAIDEWLVDKPDEPFKRFLLELMELRYDCLSSNRGGRVRRLIWTLSAFRLDGMGGWLVSFVCWLFHE